MAETTVGADLLEALEVVTQLGVDAVGEDLGVLAVDNVALSVEEPRGDLVLRGVLDDGDDSLELFGGELTGTADRVLFSFLLSLFPGKSRLEKKCWRTACSGRHRPSCRPGWSIGDRHP